MRIGIYGAGQFVHSIHKEIPFIAVDGGILSLKRLNITPKYVVGDFDSCNIQLASESYDEIIQLPCRKDYSDTEVAIQYAIELGYNEIELYGVTGGRLDHCFAVLRLLVKYKQVSITIFDDINKIFLLNPGTHCIYKQNYDYISFFSVSQTYLSLKHVEYPLDHYLLTYDNPLCLSNEIIGEYASIENDHLLYCIQSKKGDL